MYQIWIILAHWVVPISWPYYSYLGSGPSWHPPWASITSTSSRCQWWPSIYSSNPPSRHDSSWESHHRPSSRSPTHPCAPPSWQHCRQTPRPCSFPSCPQTARARAHRQRPPSNSSWCVSGWPAARGSAWLARCSRWRRWRRIASRCSPGTGLSYRSEWWWLACGSTSCRWSCLWCRPRNEEGPAWRCICQVTIGLWVGPSRGYLTAWAGRQQGTAIAGNPNRKCEVRVCCPAFFALKARSSQWGAVLRRYWADAAYFRQIWSSCASQKPCSWDPSVPPGTDLRAARTSQSWGWYRVSSSSSASVKNPNRLSPDRPYSSP